MHNVRTFRVKSPVQFVVPVIVLSVLILGIIYAISDDDTRGLSMALLGGTLLFTCILGYWLMTRARLDISPEGITYHAIGYKVHSTWANIVGIEKRQHGAYDHEWLILREPGLELSGWLGAGNKAMPFMKIVLLLGGRGTRSTDLSSYAYNIPVSVFDPDWRSGEIGTQVWTYAPKMFESPAVSTHNVRMFRMQTPMRWLVPPVVLSVLMLGVAYAISDNYNRGSSMTLLGVALLFTCILGYWMMTRARLDISPEGITYHAIGYKVYSTWSNIIGCEKRQHGYYDHESLILRETGMEMSGWLGAGNKAMPFMNLVLLLGGRSTRSTNLSQFADNIPVGVFDPDWRMGEIGSLIMMYAPQVFENQPAESDSMYSSVR